MTDSTKTALQLLQEMRQERDELNAAIQALEKRMGITPTTKESNSDEESEALNTWPPSLSIPIGFFHNLSQAAAAEKLLRLRPNKPLTTAEMLETFKASGMQVTSKNALTILYTSLKRSPKFERVGSKAWGLKEWYPERKKRILREESSEEEPK